MGIGTTLGKIACALTAFVAVVDAQHAEGRRRGAEGGAHANGVKASKLKLSGPFIDVTELGAVGDGVKDDTAAFRRAIELAIYPKTPGVEPCGDTIWIPKGTYKISGTLSIREVRGLQVLGAGNCAATLLWEPETDPGTLAAGDGQPLFRLEDVADSLFEGFAIEVGSTYPLPAAFELLSGPGDVIASDNNTLRSIGIDGRSLGVERGVRVAPASGSDKDNANHVFDDVSVENYGDAAFSLEQRSAVGIEFRSCHFDGAGIGRSGVATNRGACVDGSGVNCGGAFLWNGGGGGGNIAADFELGDVDDVLRIVGGHFESSARFVHTGGPSGNQWPVVIESNVWFDDALGTYANSPWPAAEALRIVFFQFRGPLVMSGNVLGVPPDPIQGAQIAKPSEIIWNPGNNFGQFVFEGNFWATSKANPFTGFTATGSTTGIYPTVQQGNLVEVEDFGSNAKLLPMEMHVTALNTGQATPTVGWLGTSRGWFTSGVGVDVTNLLHGTVGQKLTIAALGQRTFKAGASIQLAGGVDFTMQAGDTLTLGMFQNGVWTEISRSAP